MMRSWIFLETSSEYGNRDAIAVCERYLTKNRPARDRAEVQSKLGRCYLQEARRLRHVANEKAVEFYQKSIDANLSSLWIGKGVPELAEDLALYWLSQPATEFVHYLADDLEPFFEMIDRLPSRGHDIYPEGARVLITALRQSRAGRDKGSRHKLAGYMRRTAKRLEGAIGRDRDYPGFELLVSTFINAQAELSEKAVTS